MHGKWQITSFPTQIKSHDLDGININILRFPMVANGINKRGVCPFDVVLAALLKWHFEV